MKTLEWDDIPRPISCTTVVQDEAEQNLEGDKILKRLEIANRKLITALWTVFRLKNVHVPLLWHGKNKIPYQRRAGKGKEMVQEGDNAKESSSAEGKAKEPPMQVATIGTGDKVGTSYSEVSPLLRSVLKGGYNLG